jgi:hypothetical protein
MSSIEFSRDVAPHGARGLRLLRWFALAGAAALAACTTAGAPIVGADPSDPKAPVPAVRYQQATAGYVSQRPVTPQPWRRQNERVTPQPKPEQ